MLAFYAGGSKVEPTISLTPSVNRKEKRRNLKVFDGVRSSPTDTSPERCLLILRIGQCPAVGL